MPQFSPQDLTQSPQSIADFFTQSLGTPGVIVSVSDGIRSASVASGLSDIEEESPLHHTQHFKIGSQTKMMTGLVVLELAEEGLIDLDRPLSENVDPALIAGVANADQATVRQALQMKTGIANYTSAERPDGTTAIDIIAEHPDEVFGGEEIVALLQGLPATAAVGVEYEYSNTNYFYLSKVIEAVTGQDLGQVFQERIFAPLGMENTYLEDFRDNPDLVSTYLEFDGELIDTSDLLVDAHGEGGVISTAADMTTFLNALLVEQTLTSDTVLAALTDFESGSQDPRGFMFNNGLGLFDYEGVGTFVGFSGAIYGSDTATFLHLETGRIISTMVNLGNGSATGTGGVISTAATLADDETWQQDLQGEQLVIDGISAADLLIETQDDASVLTSDGASLRLPDHISEFDSDTFVFTDGSALLIGSGAGDRLRATSGDDQILGFGGDDQLIGSQGNDSASGGDGADQLEGGAGDDTLNGDEGNDTLRGNDGADEINGGAGDDVVFAGNDNDTVTGGLGDDSLSGSGGADQIHGDEGADTLSGENGDDELLGGVGNDVLNGGNGADTVNGGNDADMLFGNAGADSMLGGTGNDT
jgi:D-alanyl-D-alanine carboxypeptidase